MAQSRAKSNPILPETGRGTEAVELQGRGNLRAFGAATNNWLYGNAGDNALHGNAGDDLLEGGAGNDVLRGGQGDDTFVFSGAFGIDAIVGFEGGAGVGDVIKLDRSQFADINALVAAWHDDGAG